MRVFSYLPGLIAAGLGVALTGLPALPGRAQTAPARCNLVLAGRVADHEAGMALLGATARLLETGEVSTTDSAGNYHFHVCAGTYHLEVSFVGYRSESAELRVTTAVVRNFQLHPDAVQLAGTIVRGQVATAPPTQATAVLGGRALAATRGQSLGEALLNVSGVAAIQTGPNVFKPMIHGLHSNRVALLNNGVRQEGQQWGQDHGPEIDPFVASQMTVVKGAAGVRYGADAIGGAVLVQPAALPDSAGTTGQVHLVGASNNGLGAASATVQGAPRRLPALAWRVQGTVRRAGLTRTPDYWISSSTLAEYNYSAAVGWRAQRWGVEAFMSQYNARLGLYPVPENWNLTARGSSVAPLPASFTYELERPYQQIQHTLFKLSGFYKLNGWGGRVGLTLAQQADNRGEYDKYRPRNDNVANKNLPELDYRNQTTTADLRWEPRLPGNWGGELGLSGTYQDNTYRPGSRFFIPYYTNVAAGAYALGHWRPGPWLLEVGLRLDRRSLDTRRPTRASGAFAVVREDFAFTTPAASAGVVREFGPHVTLRADASLLQRAPAANERASQGVHNGIYEEGYDITRPAGAPALGPETARSAAFSLSWHDHPRLNGELTVYQSQIQNYIYQTPVPPVLDIRGLFPSYRFQQTDARFRGLDLLVAYRVARPLTLGLKAATVVERDLRQDDYLILAPADRLEGWVRYEAPAGKVKEGSSASHRVRGFYAQLGIQSVGRQTRVPRDNEVRDYQPSPPGYWLCGAEIGGTLRLAAHTPVEISVTATNLLNTSYRDYLNRYRYFLDEMGRNLTLRLRVPLAFGAPKT
ncbi:TonB-dependent receptor [Hymenobacter sp. BT664]|uniref:TonB-dependent receptor n=1 Tax=Hymenobacter montanus TaxID=2771359 RepID=A0A927GK66_9BACT|nr:TonB-dependent receptor [Hymenobacter montanus]MBD2769238.1 TonB-dependent receptor [Hymenobacter montanus]